MVLFRISHWLLNESKTMLRVNMEKEIKMGTNSCLSRKNWQQQFLFNVKKDFEERTMKKTDEKKRKTITIDITDWYDRLKEISQREFRSIEEQCRFFIKKGIDGNGDITTISYIERTAPSITTWPAQNPLWATSAGDTSNVARPFSDDTVVYCKNNAGATVSSKVGSVVDCELDKATGCYKAKC